VQEVDEMIRKFGSTTVLLRVYSFLVDEMLQMPTDTIEQCQAKVARHEQLEKLYEEAVRR
jgi:hypothetical protein